MIYFVQNSACASLHVTYNVAEDRHSCAVAPSSTLCFTGVAIYTGMETKMALNYQSKSQKRSAVEK